MGRPPKRDPKTRPDWARRLAEVREAAGYTQVKLGEIINKSQSQIGAYEIGDSEPDFAVVQQIADACHVNPGWLIFGEGDPNQGDATWGPLFQRHKNHPCFAFAFSEGARMLADEGLKADFAYLVGYAGKLLAMLEGTESDGRAEERIRAAVEAERAEIRLQMDAIRKKMR